MSGPVGFVLPAAAVGLSALLIRPKTRGFFPFNEDGSSQAPIIAQAVLEEHHNDELRITEHPVESGAAIADHAYKMPAEVIIRCLWSNSPSAPSGTVSRAVSLGVSAAAAASGSNVLGIAASLPQTIQGVSSILNNSGPDSVSGIYADLLDLQIRRVPFDVYTGKRVYHDMLMLSLATETSTKWENALMIVARCKQVLIVRTQVVTLQAGSQRDPAATAATINRGAQNLVPADLANLHPAGL